MDEIYPKDEHDRYTFWERQIEYAKRIYEPYFAVGRQMALLYNNIASSDRERMAEDFFASEEGRVKANLLFAWTDQSIANMLDRDPIFSVTPNSPVTSRGAPVVSSVTNYWYRETGQFRQDRRCLNDAFIMPYGVKKIGWYTRFDQKTEATLSSLSELVFDDPTDENLFLSDGTPTRVMPDQDHEAHIEAHMRLLQSPGMPEEVISSVIEPHIKDHEDAQNVVQPDVHTSIRYEAPFGIRWKPEHFLIDPMAQDGILDARWVAFLVQAPLYHVKANANYKNTDDLEPTTRDGKAPQIEKSPMDFDDFGIVRYWEIWARDFPVGRSRRRNMLIVLPEGHDKLLRHDEEWPYDNLEDYPCEVLNFHSDIDFWCNNTTLALAGGNNIQRLSNEFLDGMLSTARKTKNIWLFDPIYFSEREIQNILRAPDGSVFPVEDLANSEGKAILPLPFHEIPSDKALMLGQLHSLLDRAAGTPQPIRNETDETATEVAVAERRNTAREDQRANLFKEFQINTARKFWMLHSEFRPARQFLIDPRAGDWVSVDDEVVKGEYRFRIDVSSRATAKSVERNDLLRIFNLAVGVTPTFVSLGVAPPNLPEIFKMVLERGFDMTDVERFLPGQMSDQIAEMVTDPAKRAVLMQSLTGLRGGGQATAGQGPGPVNPQEYATNPTTTARQNDQAERIEG